MVKDNHVDQPAKPAEAAKPVRRAAMTPAIRYILLGAGGVLILVFVFLAGVQAADNRRGPATSRAFGRGAFTQNMRGPRGSYGGGFQPQNGIAVSGKITSVSDNDFTLDQNGSSKTVKTDSNTRFRGVGINGLKSGDQVAVSGTNNSDGSIQAVSVIVGGSTTSSSAPAPSDSSPAQSF